MTRLTFLKTLTGSLGLATAKFLGLKRDKVAEPEEKSLKSDLRQWDKVPGSGFLVGYDTAYGKDSTVSACYFTSNGEKKLFVFRDGIWEDPDYLNMKWMASDA